MPPSRFADLVARCLVVVAVITLGYLVGAQVEGMGGGLLMGSALGAGALVAVFHDNRQRGGRVAPRRRGEERVGPRTGR